MTRYEWETIREAERNEMLQKERERKVKLGKLRQKGRNRTFSGILAVLLAVACVTLAQVSDIADTAFVLFAIVLIISGVSEMISGIRQWTM